MSKKQDKTRAKRRDVKVKDDKKLNKKRRKNNKMLS
jgi:hypothetical protein